MSQIGNKVKGRIILLFSGKFGVRPNQTFTPPKIRAGFCFIFLSEMVCLEVGGRKKEECNNDGEKRRKVRKGIIY